MSPTSTQNWPVEVIGGAPEASLLRQISALSLAAQEEDGNPPLSEQTQIELRSPDADPDAVLTLAAFAVEDGSDPSTAEDLAGVAVARYHGEKGTLELVVHPNYRNQGVGALLLDKLKAIRGLAGLNAWSHGNHAAAAELAARYGYAPARELWRMRLAHQPGAPLASEPPLPAGVALRTFVPGQDEQAWLDANSAAFAHHPEQGAMTMADLKARMAEDWFDPSGFFLAVRSTEAQDASADQDQGRDQDHGHGQGREILGFHWTKVHPAQGGHPAVGEVYVVGVTPAAQGLGLGKALTLAGMRHLQSAGLKAVMLYVDADNTAAVALYRKLGFTRWDTDVSYAPAQS